MDPPRRKKPSNINIFVSFVSCFSRQSVPGISMRIVRVNNQPAMACQVTKKDGEDNKDTSRSLLDVAPSCGQLCPNLFFVSFVCFCSKSSWFLGHSSYMRPRKGTVPGVVVNKDCPTLGIASLALAIRRPGGSRKRRARAWRPKAGRVRFTDRNAGSGTKARRSPAWAA